MNRSRIIILLSLILLPLALLINLGLMTFIDDEGIRSLVALEMSLSGNFIVPTLHGEYYYNKPPLFNWILLLIFELSGRVNEFVARLPTILALLGYGLTVFLFFRKHYDVKISFLNAFLVITCGRILFWDSMLGLIDITFSWVVFTSFMLIYHSQEKQKWKQLFVLSYLLASIGFMLKGLPAIVFQGTTLVVYLIYLKQFKKLFSLAHLMGLSVFVVVVGGYYLIYHQYHDLIELSNTLFWESYKRTAFNYDWTDGVLNLFSFPFEMVYHFLPWSLLVICFLRRDVIKLILKDSFITFNLLVFLANIIVYWTSPNVYPRYLLMHAPLIFSVYLYLFFIHKKENTWQFRSIEYTFLFIIGLISLGSFLPLFLERTASISWRVPKSLFLGFSMLAITYFYYRWRSERLLLLVLFLMVFRIGFNWFVLPDRNQNDFGDLSRVSSQRVGENFKNRDLYLYKDIEMQMTSSFYMTEKRRQIIKRKWDSFDENSLYIIYPQEDPPEFKYEVLDSFVIRLEKSTYYVVEMVK